MRLNRGSGQEGDSSEGEDPTIGRLFGLIEVGRIAKMLKSKRSLDLPQGIKANCLSDLRLVDLLQRMIEANRKGSIHMTIELETGWEGVY